MEIEKRYEIKGETPKDKIIDKIYIEQVYNNINPDVRIRKMVHNNEIQYFHTVKYNTNNQNARIEIETPITEELYNQIYKLIDKKPVRKNRYCIPLDDSLVAEVDEFLDINKIIIEVEFSNEEDMNNFKKPDWFGDEIKGKQSFNLQVFSEINVSVKFY